MNCVFSPYKITSPSFPGIEGTTFIDTEKTRRVAIVAPCGSVITAPCEGAIAVSQMLCEESNCNIRWYECPGILGRTYTIFPTPCGVTITSFEDGLLSLNGCSATDFGSFTFCFGKIYTSAGEFDAGNPQISSFELDGHTFVIEGVAGQCNEFLDCGPCASADNEVTAFATLPDAPPELADKEIEVKATPDDEVVPETEIIPSENRTVWHNVPELGPPDTGIGTQCSDEVNVTSWTTPGTTPTSGLCVSSDNPSIATLPSGHTIIAYESRSDTGLTRIRVAILKSSANKNIIYYRKLSKGTLINDTKNSQQVFEIFEEMFIGTNTSDNPVDSSLTIGFLSGPLIGAKPQDPEGPACTINCLYSVDTVVRSIDNNRVKHTITFTPEVPTVFPDQNDISNVSWFLANDAGGDIPGGDIPPDSSNVITILDKDLTAHKFPIDDSGVQVPVANPSIAVARNNQMISSEQNIFLVYQAFEENQWRVYLRQITLGGASETSPTYSIPYLFPDQSQVSIMSFMSFDAVSTFASGGIFDDTFSYYSSENNTLESRAEWNRIDTPVDDIAGGIEIYTNQSLLLCKNLNPIFPTSGCSPQGNNTCRLEFGTGSTACGVVGSNNSDQWIKSFYSSTIPAEDSNSDGFLRTKLSVKFSIEQGLQTDFYPEVWFLLGRTLPTSDFQDGWRIRVERHNGPSPFGNQGGSFIPESTCGTGGLLGCNSNCFIISIYNGYDLGHQSWRNRFAQQGTRFDRYLRQIKVCVNTIDGSGDYIRTEWNTISVETYMRGRHRVFKVVLNNSNNTNYKLVEFQEMDESTLGFNDRDTEPITFGKYYGFGFINHDVPIRSSIDQVTLTAPDEDNESKHIFYEEFFDAIWYDLHVSNSAFHRSNQSRSRLRYVSQITNEPNTAWQTYGYKYTDLILCNSGLDTRYPRTIGFNTWVDQGNDAGKLSYDHLTINSDISCDTSIDATSDAFWSILKVTAPAELRRNLTSPFNSIYDTTMYASFSHGDHIEGNGEQWGNIWFLLRQDSASSDWHTGWRLRIRYYIASGVSKYLLSVYDEDSSVGDPTDVPVSSILIDPAVNITKLFVHTPNSTSGSPAPYRDASILYFKVDIVTSATTQIDVSIGFKTGTSTQPSEHVFFPIHSFTGLSNKHFGSYYGLALMSGATNSEFIDAGDILSTRDFRAQPIVDYLQIRSFVDIPTAPTGACCRAIGVCEDTTENNCISPDIWDITETCDTVDCTPHFAFGASCREADGACFYSTLAGVPTDFGDFVGGEWTAGDNCTLGDTDYRGCPQPTGSCCKPDGTCSGNQTKEECEVFWGLNFQNSYWIKDGDCSDITCGSPPASTGACCIDSFTGCHTWVTAGECTVLGGTFLGVGTDCTSCEGACCHDSGTLCDDTYYYDCLTRYTTPVWFGNGTTCADVGFSCSATLQPCCFADGQCGVISFNACLEFNGVWDEDSCSPNSCTQPPGACCDPLTGDCSSIVQSDCISLGRTFVGGSCSSANCVQPLGACCIGATCSQKNLLDCTSNNGLYFGDNSQCLPNHCALQDPYISHSVNYKPEDLWVIQTGDNNFATRVLYHMQEDNILSNVIGTDGDASNEIDFMFIIDHSASMWEELQAISTAVPALAASLNSKGLDVRFAFVIHARGTSQEPVPASNKRTICIDTVNGQNTYMFDALQGTNTCASKFVICPDPPDSTDEVDGAWTRSPTTLQAALKCWCIEAGPAAGYAAIQFGIENSRFNDSTNGWRTDAKKYIFMVTDTSPTECSCDCSGFDNTKEAAVKSLQDGPPGTSGGVILIPSVCDPDTMSCGGSGGQDYADLSITSGWEGGLFQVNSENYGDIFDSIVSQIDISVRQDKATIMERATAGTDNAFLKQAETIITYDGDLSDLWTFNKTDFEFKTDHAPFPGTNTKSLSNFPFDLASGKIYGIDSVHIQGIPENWVSFGQEGALQFAYPNIGTRASSVADPVLMSTNSTRPKVFVNNRNQVIVAYESYESGSAQIAIKGTGDFHQNSITGPKGSRLQRFYAPSEFTFNHAVTLDGEGVNQLCDFVIDSSDITHITWQSNRDGEWEIYYANSSNLFDPIRLTKSDSRSSMPSIDVEESGNIFVVYHDNRFGPFEVMLATKTEERVLALLEQDAYMASIRNNYAHYTNTMPVVLANPASNEFVQSGQLWASKTADGAGNDNEDFVYKLNQDTGLPSEGGDSGFGMDHIAFHPDGKLYGIQVVEDDSSKFGSDQATLYLISNFSDPGAEPEITQTPTVIGNIDLETWNYDNSAKQTGRIIDIDFDSFGRLWLHIWNRAEFDEESGNPDFVNQESQSTLRWIDVKDASVIAETRPGSVTGKFVDAYGSDRQHIGNGAGFAIDSNNNFYIGGKSIGPTGVPNKLFISPYPIITSDVIDPSGPKLAVVDFAIFVSGWSSPIENGSMIIRSMAFNELDQLVLLHYLNDLFLYNMSGGTEIQLLTSLTTDSQDVTGPLPVGTTSSITLVQTSTSIKTHEGDDYFHVLIEFYDNFAMAGEPYLTVDSRENIEAFISEESISDPYSPYLVSGMDARGIFLEEGQTGIIFFDATQFRPGFPRQSVPYSFEPNQTYFPKVFSINSNSSVTETVRQNSSFSCSKCSRFGTNNFDSSGCSYSFVVTNTSGQDQWYNFKVDFYADLHKQHLLRRFNLIGGNSDLQFVEVDNQAGMSQWGTNGLKVTDKDSVFIQVYPSLDPSAGFLCGIHYAIQVNQCFVNKDESCSDFVVLIPDNWEAIEVQGPEQISTDFTSLAIKTSGLALEPVAIGLDMHNIGNKIALAYRTQNNNLAYVTYDGVGTWTNDLIAPNITNGVTGYVSMGTLEGRAAVVFTTSMGSSPNIHLRSRILNGTTWNDGIISRNAWTTTPWRPVTIFNETGIVTAVTPRPSQQAEQYHIGSSTGQSDPVGNFGERGGPIGDFCDTATIDGSPHIAFWRGNFIYMGIRLGAVGVTGNEWDLFLVDEDLSFSRGSTPSESETPGRPGIVELDNGLIAIAYIKQDDAIQFVSPVTILSDQRRLMFRTFDGNSWTNVDMGVGRDTYNKSLAIAIVNGQPYIAYTIGKGTTCDLKVAIYNGESFQHEVVAEGIPTQDPQVDIIEFQSRAVITITSSPLMVYLQRKDSLITLGEIGSSFFCECSSKIFPDRMVHIAELSRWEATAHGYSDTRVTESPKNSLRPKVATRSTGVAIIIWEDNNCENAPCIKAATFRNINQDQLRSSGTGSWYDFDFNTHGQHPNLALDVYDRATTTYEKPIASSADGFFGTQSIKEELPANEIWNRVCDFDPDQVSSSIGGVSDKCDIESIKTNVITTDEFISSTIVKKIRVKDEFVQYYTYNASGKLTAVVSGCEISLEIHGTPEIVALRLRNENQTNFGPWCPWSPQIGDFMMEKQHKLSGNTGIKEVCVQAMTYIGVTVQFCVPIIADYETIVFETQFYKNTLSDPENFRTLSGDKFSQDDSQLEKLPLSDGLAVANLAPQIDDTSPSEVIVLVEITPSKDPEDTVQSISYDVLQQGTDDTAGLTAIKGKNNDGRITFRGFFTIKREDKVLSVDGLARVNPKFPQVCDEGGGNPGSANIYNPDRYNVIFRETEVEITEATDVLESYRQDVSGRVGVDIDIRSQEDPYFIFGDPNYSLRKQDGERAGVPLEVPAGTFGLGLGIAPNDPCFGQSCPPDKICDSETGNCVPRVSSG